MKFKKYSWETKLKMDPTFFKMEGFPVIFPQKYK